MSAGAQANSEMVVAVTAAEKDDVYRAAARVMKSNRTTKVTWAIELICIYFIGGSHLLDPIDPGGPRRKVLRLGPYPEQEEQIRGAIDVAKTENGIEDDGAALAAVCRRFIAEVDAQGWP